MPADIVARTFDAACLPELAGFDCGPDQFGTIATDWIRCTDPSDCALQAIAERQTEVILYSTPGGVLVGYGSLGRTTRRIKKVEEIWSIIPHIGIDHAFRGCPTGAAWQDRYAATIMVDLMALAREHGTPTLMLKVHCDNQPARKLYDRLGFMPLGGPNAEGYETMIIANHS